MTGNRYPLSDIRHLFLKRMTEKIIALFNLNKGNRFKNYGYFEGIISVVLNIVLFGFKFAFGVLLNSISLIADSLHSLSDLVTSTIVIFGCFCFFLGVSFVEVVRTVRRVF